MKEVKVFDFMNTSDKRSIFHENDQKFKEIEERDKRMQKIKKMAVYSGAFVVLASSIVLAKKQINYLNQPVQIVTNDILSNEGFLLTDDGRTVDAKKFDRDEKEDMYAYVKKHNIKADDIREQITKQMEKDGLDSELILEQLKDKYPGIFGDTPVINVRPIKEGKAK